MLSHYFSDPFMPLHTGQSEDRDARSTGRWNGASAKSYGACSRSSSCDLGGYPQLEAPPREDWLEQMIVTGARAQPTSTIEPVLAPLRPGPRRPKNPLAGMDQECKHRIAECLAHAVVGFARVLEKALAEAEVEPPLSRTTLLGFLAVLAAPLKRGRAATCTIWPSG